MEQEIWSSPAERVVIMPLDGKTVITFCGRVHHWQRLSPVVDELRRRGCIAPYVVSDNATNNDPAVEYLISAGEQFVHILDFLDAESTERTTGMTHDILHKIAKYNDKDTDIRSFVSPFWLAYSVREACEFICATNNMEKALDTIKPDMIMVLHTNNFWGRMLAHLGYRRHIPVVAYQEGRLRARDEKTLKKQGSAADDCSKIMCWSESARQAYIGADIPESKLAVTGIPHLEQWFGYMENQETWEMGKKLQKGSLGFDSERKLVSFCPPLLSRYDGSPKTALGALADWSANEFIQLAIRLHPFEHEENVERLKFGLRSHPYAKVIESDTLALIACSDVVVSQHSTVAVEALALNVPLIELDLDNVGVLESLAEQGVAIPVAGGELSKIMQVLSGELKASPTRLEEWITQNIGPRDSGIVDRVIFEIENLI